MTRIKVKTVVHASRRATWAEVADLPSHVEWMADAREIRFLSARRSGVGTTFECDTVVGPLKLTDLMEVTEWKDKRAIGIRHVGVVRGSGTISLRRRRFGRRGTVVEWKERLRFPWWMGGPVGGAVGGRILKRIWRSNLRRLAARIEHPEQ